MALWRLIARPNNMTPYINNINAIENVQHYFQKNITGSYQQIIEHVSDVITFEYIIFEFYPEHEMSIHNFMYLLEMEATNKSKIYFNYNEPNNHKSFDLLLLAQLNKPRLTGSNIAIKLPNYLISNFIAISSVCTFYSCNVSLNTPLSELVNKMSLIKTHNYRDIISRNELLDTRIIRSQCVLNTTLIHTQTHINEQLYEQINTLQINTLSKGMFIYAKNISIDIHEIKIYNVSVHMTDEILFNWHHELTPFGIFVQIISPDMIYINTESTNRSYDTIDNLIEGINTTNETKISIKIKRANINDQNNIIIYQLVKCIETCFQYYSLSYNTRDLEINQQIINQEDIHIIQVQNFLSSPWAIYTDLHQSTNNNTPLMFITKWRIANKLLNPNVNDICPISYDTINKKDIYTTCIICSYNFKIDNLLKWFIMCTICKTCPMCRSEWSNANYIMYINT
jgi:hypothetical protein